MAQKSNFMGKSEFQGKKSSFKLFGKIEFPPKRTKKACLGLFMKTYDSLTKIIQRRKRLITVCVLCILKLSN